MYRPSSVKRFQVTGIRTQGSLPHPNGGIVFGELVFRNNYRGKNINLKMGGFLE